MIVGVILISFLGCGNEKQEKPKDSFINLSTPENTLGSYIESQKRGDLVSLKKTHELRGQNYYLPGPILIKSYKILKKTIFTNKEVDKWNGAEIIPRAEIGDVQLDVKEFFAEGSQMYSYNMRKFENEWKIISHSAWGCD